MRKVLVILLLISGLYLQAQEYYSVDRLTRISVGGENEIGAVPFKNGLVYVTDRSMSSAKDVEVDDGVGYNIFYADSSNGKWSAGKLLSNELKTDLHDGPISFTAYGTKTCFVRIYSESGVSGQSGNRNAGLYFAEDVNGKWSNITAFEHNEYDFTYFTPSLSRDGNTLVFSANLEDSRGEFDLYVSYLENGRWSVPENLGDGVNTDQNEMFPFIHPSGRLYFSSKGHDNGAGNSDFFYTKREGESWAEAVKLPEPLNSNQGDVSIWLSDDFSEGVISSKRYGNRSESDLFSFRKESSVFDLPRPIQNNKLCYTLRENSLDTIDYETFKYEWVINDTMKLYGHKVRVCFPGEGDYDIHFNVYNLVTDTAMLDEATIFFPLRIVHQPVITSLDTAYVNQTVKFSAKDTYLPAYEIGEYYWDFGDLSEKESGMEVEYSYSSPGTYRVVLAVLEYLPESIGFEPESFAVYKDVLILPPPE